MNDLILQAAGDVQAVGVLDFVENTAGDVESTILTLIGAALYVGAIVQAARAKFSVSSIIIGLIMVGVGTAVLSQVDSIADMFEDEVDNQNAHAVVQESQVIALELGEGPLLLSVDEQAA